MILYRGSLIAPQNEGGNTMSEENLYTFENEAYRKTYWHTCSHVMAQAVKRLYPQVSEFRPSSL